MGFTPHRPGRRRECGEIGALPQRPKQCRGRRAWQKLKKRELLKGLMEEQPRKQKEKEMQAAINQKNKNKKSNRMDTRRGQEGKEIEEGRRKKVGRRYH